MDDFDDLLDPDTVVLATAVGAAFYLVLALLNGCL